MRWIRVFAAVLSATTLNSGCTTSLDTEENDGEESDVGEAEIALDSHDGHAGGQPTAPSPDCMEACRAVLSACVSACRTLPIPEHPACARRCALAYLDCTSMCDTGQGQGCDSLNPADCSPWAHP